MISFFGAASTRLRWRMSIIMVVGVAALVAIAAGPRPEIDETVRFDMSSVGADVGQWLAEREAAVAGIKPGAEKEIVWADPATRAKTPLAVVYIHGFSATKWETRPLPDKVAAALGANLFFTRLTGHGQDGAALARASMNDWVNDMAEAIAVGERIGERVLVIATSTGATLATWAVGNERLVNKVVGLVLISPNYQLNGISVGLLNMAWGQQLLPLVFGQTRSFEPVNERQAQWWTTSYPSRSVFAMAALMRAVERMDHGRSTVPALFIHSPNDKVVSAETTRRVHDEWAGPKAIHEVEQVQDPSSHVLAGDILSPGTTDELVGRIVEWAGGLER
ncbi:MAG: lysophospholipase [Alphaproteobacteria bacterium]|nr:MAG: lysophospholipase [Alphaproteobacteria bacterium]